MPHSRNASAHSHIVRENSPPEEPIGLAADRVDVSGRVCLIGPLLTAHRKVLGTPEAASRTTSDWLALSISLPLTKSVTVARTVGLTAAPALRRQMHHEAAAAMLEVVQGMRDPGERPRVWTSRVR